MTLTLTFAGISVTLGSFSSQELPRRRLDVPVISYTARNVVNRRGLAVVAPHLWIITGAKLTRQAGQNLQDMHDAYLESPGPLILDDLIQPFSELTITKPLAAGAPAAETINGRQRYFAEWSVEFQQDFILEQRGRWTLASFQLIEV